MPSIGHIAVGMAAGQGTAGERRHRLAWILWLVAVSCLADLDLIAGLAQVPHNTLLGHRGISHSLGFSVLAGIASAAVAPRWGRGRWVGGVVGFLTYASHLTLDCLNVGSVGVPWLWPLSPTYYSLPWAPIPAVISAHDFLTPRGLPVLAAELVLFSPLWLYALLGRTATSSGQERTRPLLLRRRRRAQSAVE